MHQVDAHRVIHWCNFSAWSIYERKECLKEWQMIKGVERWERIFWLWCRLYRGALGTLNYGRIVVGYGSWSKGCTTGPQTNLDFKLQAECMMDSAWEQGLGIDTANWQQFKHIHDAAVHRFGHCVFQLTTLIGKTRMNHSSIATTPNTVHQLESEQLQTPTSNQRP